MNFMTVRNSLLQDAIIETPESIILFWIFAGFDPVLKCAMMIVLLDPLKGRYASYVNAESHNSETFFKSVTFLSFIQFCAVFLTDFNPLLLSCFVP